MPDEQTDQNKRPPQRTLITTRSEYLAAADRLFGLAQRELRIFDTDLNALRLDAPARIAQLRAFLLRGRDNKLYISVRDVEYVRQYCPRLTALLGNFAASLFIWHAQGEAAKVQDCFVLADREHLVRRPVAAQPRGAFILDDPREGLVMYERFSEIWDSSVPGISANTTGL